MLVPQKRIIPVKWNEYTFLTEEVTVAYPPDWQIESEYSISVTLKGKRGEFIFIIDVSAEQWDIGPKALRIAKMKFAEENSLYQVRFVEQGSLDIPWNNVYFKATSKDYEYGVESNELYILVGDSERQASIHLVVMSSAQVFSNTVNIAKQIAASVRFMDVE